MAADLETYLKRIDESSTRTRSTLYLLLTFCLLLSFALWNGRPGNWDHNQIQLLKRLTELLNGTNRPADELTARALRFAELGGINIDELSLETMKMLKEQLIQKSNDLQKFQRERHNYVTLPGMGPLIRYNDMGLFGGLGLVALLFVLRFSLAREYDNLFITFAKASESSSLQDAYNLLTMSQVLSTPPRLNIPEKQGYFGWSLWGQGQKYLYFLPAVVQIGIISLDLITISHAWVLSPANSTIVVISSGVNLIAMLGLAWSCFSVATETDELWTTTFNKLRPDHPVVAAD